MPGLQWAYRADGRAAGKDGVMSRASKQIPTAIDNFYTKLLPALEVLRLKVPTREMSTELCFASFMCISCSIRQRAC